MGPFCAALGHRSHQRSAAPLCGTGRAGAFTWPDEPKLLVNDPGFKEEAQAPFGGYNRVIAYDKTAGYWAAMDETDAGGQWRVMKLAR